MIRRALLRAIRFYATAISPALPPRCRFQPTCSAYAVEALERHGAARGSWLALRRLLKCAPWHPGGYDPVPAARGTAEPAHSSGTADQAAAGPRIPPDRATPPDFRRAIEESSVA